MDKKRQRNTNFSPEETDRLIFLIEKHKDVVENKKSDADIWLEKSKVWMGIEKDFNRVANGSFRDAKHLKLKYEALKRDTRKKCSVIRAKRYRPGGVNKATPLTPVEQKIRKIILLSIDGDESTYESDPLELGTSENVDEHVCVGATAPLKLEDKVNDSMTAASFNIVPLQTPPQESVENTHIFDSSPATSNEVDPEIQRNSSKRKCTEWKSASLKSRRHPSTPSLQRGSVQAQKGRARFNIFARMGSPGVIPRPHRRQASSKLRKKRPYRILVDAKLVTLQKQIFEEELEEKRLRKQLLENELAHKTEMYALEKQQILLNIETLKRNLENKYL